MKAPNQISSQSAHKDNHWISEGVDRDFVRDMTHEVHTPLNVIIGLCQLLERDRTEQLSPAQQDAVQRMERNAHSLLRTVDRLLACVRSGRYEIERGA